MFELLLKIHEYNIHNLRLHFSGYLLIERKLLNNHIKIVKQGILDIASYLLIKHWRNVKRLV